MKTNPPASPRFHPWPCGIVAAFVVFIGGITALVTTAQRHGRSELVSADYYDREIRYQSTLDAEKRALAYDAELRVDYDAAAGSVRLGLPRHHATAGLEGSVAFYRPSGAAQDRTLPLAVKADGSQDVATSELMPGPWDVRVRWKAEGQEFAFSRRLLITAR